jgi:secreted trypsin-like serine protease
MTMRAARLAAATVAALALAPLLGATAASAQVVQSSPVPTIVGGKPAKGQPWMGSMQLILPGQAARHFCGAVLVEAFPGDRKHAVTNAHCVTLAPTTETRPTETLSIRFNSADWTTGGLVVGVKKILPHADWAWAVDLSLPVSDIAVLELDRSVPFKPLPVSHTIAMWRATTALGWGKTDPAATQPPLILQQYTTRFLPAAACADGFIGVGELCVASRDGVGVCNGDSGGPTVQKYRDRFVAVGTASRLGDHGVCGGPNGTGNAVYTDLSYYRGWIARTARRNEVPPSTHGPAQSKLATEVPLHNWTVGDDVRPRPKP